MSDQGELALALGYPVEDAFADGRLFLIFDDPKPYRDRFVHVMSRPAGGEIRGYIFDGDNRLRIRQPNYHGHWPELDLAVAKRTGAEVAA